jgi:hypothetical protein
VPFPKQSHLSVRFLGSRNTRGCKVSRSLNLGNAGRMCTTRNGMVSGTLHRVRVQSPGGSYAYGQTKPLSDRQQCSKEWWEYAACVRLHCDRHGQRRTSGAKQRLSRGSMGSLPRRRARERMAVQTCTPHPKPAHQGWRHTRSRRELLNGPLERPQNLDLGDAHTTASVHGRVTFTTPLLRHPMVVKGHQSCPRRPRTLHWSPLSAQG